MKKLITVHVITMKRKVFRKQTANRRRQSLQITGKRNVFRKINQRVFCVVYLNLCLLCVRRCNSFIRVFALQNLAQQVSRYLNAFLTHHGYIRPFGNGLLHISSKEFIDNRYKIQKFLCHYTENHHATSHQAPVITSSTNSIAVTSTTFIPMSSAASTSHGHIKGKHV